MLMLASLFVLKAGDHSITQGRFKSTRYVNYNHKLIPPKYSFSMPNLALGEEVYSICILNSQ